MKRFVLLRGPSGTGKSTIAKAIERETLGDGPMSTRANIPITVTVEADMFHTKLDGTYAFDFDRLSDAHRWCQLQTQFWMFKEADLVIVSNTSTTHKECVPYLDLANQFGYEAEVIRTPGPWDTDVLFQRNTHNVPLATLEKQIARYTPLDDRGETAWSDMEVFN